MLTGRGPDFAIASSGADTVSLGGGGDGASDGLGNDEYRAAAGNDTLIVFDGGRDAFSAAQGVTRRRGSAIRRGS